MTPNIAVQEAPTTPVTPGPSSKFPILSTEEKQQLVADLKAKHGDLIEVSVPCEPSIFVISKRADRAIHRARKADRNHEVYKDLVDDRLCEACVVWPDQHILNAVFDKYPYFVGELAGEIMLFSGATTDRNRAKKL